mmetsp:Transcript_12716/g.14605  ORF Transcript_12716/g.14605 Transcript_12716/m.14605 type:complete len:110 (+) Transcript_12716:14-343(+)
MVSQQSGSMKGSNQPSFQGNDNPNTSLDGSVKNQQNNTMKMNKTSDPEIDDGPRKVQQRFQSLSLRDYYDTSALTTILSKGLEELAKNRPSNPVKFLAQYLMDNDPEGN